MPRNISGGSGHKRMKNSVPSINKNVDNLKKSTNIEDFEFYGKCIKPLGNRRFEVLSQAPNDKVVTLHCRLAGSCRKKIQKDAFVLVQLYPFNLTQGQIANVYDNDDVLALKKAGVWDFTTDVDDPFDVMSDMADMFSNMPDNVKNNENENENVNDNENGIVIAIEDDVI
jgi:translation initiation factor IF-1